MLARLTSDGIEETIAGRSELVFRVEVSQRSPRFLTFTLRDEAGRSVSRDIDLVAGGHTADLIRRAVTGQLHFIADATSEIAR